MKVMNTSMRERMESWKPKAQTISRHEVLDAVADAMLMHASKVTYDNSTADEAEIREVDRLRHLRTAIMAGQQLD